MSRSLLINILFSKPAFVVLAGLSLSQFVVSEHLFWLATPPLLALLHVVRFMSVKYVPTSSKSLEELRRGSAYHRSRYPFVAGASAYAPNHSAFHGSHESSDSSHEGSVSGSIIDSPVAETPLFAVNPTTGLAMMNDTMDVGGNLFCGIDFDSDSPCDSMFDSDFSSSIDDDF